jgi:hypothetical protein
MLDLSPLLSSEGPDQCDYNVQEAKNGRGAQIVDSLKFVLKRRRTPVGQAQGSNTDPGIL